MTRPAIPCQQFTSLHRRMRKVPGRKVFLLVAASIAATVAATSHAAAKTICRVGTSMGPSQDLASCQQECGLIEVQYYLVGDRMILSPPKGRAKRHPGVMAKVTSCSATRDAAGYCVYTICGPEIPLSPPKTPRSARGLPQKPQPNSSNANMVPQPGLLEGGAAFAPQAPAPTGTPLTSSSNGPGGATSTPSSGGPASGLPPTSFSPTFTPMPKAPAQPH